MNYHFFIQSFFSHSMVSLCFQEKGINELQSSSSLAVIIDLHVFQDSSSCSSQFIISSSVFIDFSLILSILILIFYRVSSSSYLFLLIFSFLHHSFSLCLLVKFQLHSRNVFPKLIASEFHLFVLPVCS